MPELPEVEQVRISLLPHVKGKQIEQVRVDVPKMVHHPDAKTFCETLKGKTILDVGRKGKYLRLELEENLYLLVHLRMTGALLAVPKKEPEPPFTRMAFVLSGAETLYFSDIRKFGTVELIGLDTYRDAGYEALGPELLDKAMTPSYLKEKAKGKTARVKSFILDQSVIAGLGNIYADESLFAAKIRPTRRVNTLTKKEWELLTLSIQQVIAQGLRHHGTTFRNYQDADGKMGDNAAYLKVYHHKGEPCPVCGTPLKQIKVAGRGSVYCPHCQR